MPTGDSALFARLGIRREQDLVLHLPIRYEDETRITPIADVHPGEPVQIEGVVVRHEIVARPRRTLVVDVRDDTGALAFRFFHFYGSQLRHFVTGSRVRALGEARGGLFGLEMVHPRYRVVGDGDPLPEALTPVYPTVSGLGQARLRTAILRALRALDWRETVPADALARLGLPSAADALREIHWPSPDTPASALHERATPA
ncbi:MAG TPA: ATP-dependent DNA helicase RecG, partial [Burkholderiaceae bacterium]|nr:ATP-dependent DNA helicase RecG [Burkholderiaceae bacterium]